MMTQLKEPLKPAPEDLQRDFRAIMKRIDAMEDGEKYGSMLWIQNTVMNYMVVDHDRREIKEIQTRIIQVLKSTEHKN
jgi:hypothetical protein